MRKRVRLSPPPTNLGDTNSRPWFDWFNNVFSRLGEGPVLIQGYSVSVLPDATQYGNEGSEDPFSSVIFIRDEAGGSTLAFSDGTDWRRVSDRTIVS